MDVESLVHEVPNPLYMSKTTYQIQKSEVCYRRIMLIVNKQEYSKSDFRFEITSL